MAKSNLGKSLLDDFGIDSNSIIEKKDKEDKSLVGKATAMDKKLSSEDSLRGKAYTTVKDIIGGETKLQQFLKTEQENPTLEGIRKSIVSSGDSFVPGGGRAVSQPKEAVMGGMLGAGVFSEGMPIVTGLMRTGIGIGAGTVGSDLASSPKATEFISSKTGLEEKDAKIAGKILGGLAGSTLALAGYGAITGVPKTTGSLGNTEHFNMNVMNRIKANLTGKYVNSAGETISMPRSPRIARGLAKKWRKLTKPEASREIKILDDKGNFVRLDAREKITAIIKNKRINYEEKANMIKSEIERSYGNMEAKTMVMTDDLSKSIRSGIENTAPEVRTLVPEWIRGVNKVYGEFVDDIHNLISVKNPTLNKQFVSDFLDDFTGDLMQRGQTPPPWLSKVLSKYGVKEVKNGYTILDANGKTILKQTNAQDGIPFNSLLDMVKNVTKNTMSNKKGANEADMIKLLFKNSFVKKVSMQFDDTGALGKLNKQYSPLINAGKSIAARLNAYSKGTTDFTQNSLKSMVKEIQKNGDLWAGSRQSLEQMADDIDVSVLGKTLKVKGVGDFTNKLRGLARSAKNTVRANDVQKLLKEYETRMMGKILADKSIIRDKQLLKREMAVKSITGIKTQLRLAASDLIKGVALFYTVKQLSKRAMNVTNDNSTTVTQNYNKE